MLLWTLQIVAVILGLFCEVQTSPNTVTTAWGAFIRRSVADRVWINWKPGQSKGPFKVFFKVEDSQTDWLPFGDDIQHPGGDEVLSVKVTGLEPSTIYNLRIEGLNEQSPVVRALTRDLPWYDEKITFKELDSGRVNVSWEPLQGDFDFAALRYCDESETVRADCKFAHINLPKRNVVLELNDGERYTFSIEYYQWDVLIAMTANYKYPPVETISSWSVTVTKPTAYAFYVTWTPGKSHGPFSILQKITNGTKWQVYKHDIPNTGDGGMMSVLVERLLPDTKYYIQIETSDARSPPIIAQTRSLPPPPELSVEQQGLHVEVSWKPLQGDFDWALFRYCSSLDLDGCTVKSLKKSTTSVAMALRKEETYKFSIELYQEDELVTKSNEYEFEPDFDEMAFSAKQVEPEIENTNTNNNLVYYIVGSVCAAVGVAVIALVAVKIRRKKKQQDSTNSLKSSSSSSSESEL